MMTRMQWLTCACALSLTLGACSDDSDGPQADNGATKNDGPGVISDATAQPWPDLPASQDATQWACTAGEEGMCDDNKLQYCANGLCTKCPPNYVDCDRQGDCECLGACDGQKCVSPGGKN